MVKQAKRKFNILRLLITILVSLILMGAIAVVGVLMYTAATTEDVDFTKISGQLEESSFILDQSGKVIDKIASPELQVVVPVEKISTWMKQAVVAIEDERFYKHNGVDVIRVFGAAWNNVKTGSFSQGASTITMQVAKNLYTSTEKSLDRKIKDAYYAMEMEKVLSKEQILHAYLNTMPLSRGTVGVEAAANTFFNKPAINLDLAESAMLAGITQSPVKFSPYVTKPIDPNGDLANMQIAVMSSGEEVYVPTKEELGIYERLFSLGKVGSTDYEYLKSGTKFAREAVVNDKSKARQEVVLKKMLDNKMIDKATYDAAVAQSIKLNLKVKPSNTGNSYFIDTMMEQVKSELLKAGFKEEDVDSMLASGGLRIYSTMDKNIQNKIQKQADNPQNFPGSFVDANGVVQPQTAIVIMEQKTGQVKGLVGGRSLIGSKLYNRATNPRQPGSSIKPLVAYMPALERGFTAATVVADSPRPDGKGKYWPKNAEGYKGNSTLGPLIASSSNVAAVEILNKIGIDVGLESLKKQGISTLVTRDNNSRVNDENLSLALGGMTKGTTDLDMTRAFATIANGGTKMKPIFFTKIETSTGRVIFENKQESEKIFKTGNTYIMTHMMEEALRSGTGKYGRLENMTAAGKTGTTTDRKDTWFVGFTPYYTAGVWIGADMPVELVDHSRMAAKLWKNVMSDVHQGLKNKPFDVPPDVVAVKINRKTGGPSSSGVTEYFIKGTEPTRSSGKKDIIKTEFDNLEGDQKKESTLDNSGNETEDNFVPGVTDSGTVDDLFNSGNTSGNTEPPSITEPVVRPETPLGPAQPEPIPQSNTGGTVDDLIG